MIRIKEWNYGDKILVSLHPQTIDKTKTKSSNNNNKQIITIIPKKQTSNEIAQLKTNQNRTFVKNKVNRKINYNPKMISQVYTAKDGNYNCDDIKGTFDKDPLKMCDTKLTETQALMKQTSSMEANVSKSEVNVRKASRKYENTKSTLKKGVNKTKNTLSNVINSPTIPEHGKRQNFAATSKIGYCETCQENVIPQVRYKVGQMTYLLSSVLIPVFGCLIPFCMNRCKSKINVCPKCNKEVVPPTVVNNNDHNK